MLIWRIHNSWNIWEQGKILIVVFQGNNNEHKPFYINVDVTAEKLTEE